MTESANSLQTESNLKGLRGWLVLVGLGVVLTPFKMLFELFSIYKTLFIDGSIQDMSDPASAAFVPYLSNMIYTELIINAIFLTWAFINIYLFFSCRSKFPRFYIFFLIANLVFLVLDAFISTNFMTYEEAFDRDTVKVIVQLAISTAIWVPYMLVSKRVKNTFIE